MKRQMQNMIACALVLAFCAAGPVTAAAAQLPTEQTQAAAFLKEQGIMVGNETGDMMLDSGLTRAQLAAIIARMAASEEHLQADQVFYAGQCSFTDLPEWAKVYVGYCVTNHLVTGYGNSLYGPHDAVTSAAACTVMLRSLEDVGTDWTYQSACLKAVELELAPAAAVSEHEITRGNMAILLYRTMQRLGLTEDSSTSVDSIPEMAVTPADGEQYIPTVGDVIVCDDGYRYEITDVSKWNNSMFATGETAGLPEPTCDWSLLPQPELPTVEKRHFTSNGREYLFMRNLYETRRMQYTLYNAIGANDQTWKDGKPVTMKNGDPMVRINLSIPDGVNAYSFWPWRSNQITELFNSCPPGEYSCEAWDVYCDGVFRYTEYYIHVK